MYSSVIFGFEFVEHVLLIDREVHLVRVVGHARGVVDALRLVVPHRLNPCAVELIEDIVEVALLEGVGPSHLCTWQGVAQA